MKVYMIADYNEYGSEHCRVTLDPGKLEGFVRDFYTVDPEEMKDLTSLRRKAHYDELLDEAIDALKEGLLEETCEAWNLTNDWGGLQLFILELE